MVPRRLGIVGKCAHATCPFTVRRDTARKRLAQCYLGSSINAPVATWDFVEIPRCDWGVYRRPLNSRAHGIRTARDDA